MVQERGYVDSAAPNFAEALTAPALPIGSELSLQETQEIIANSGGIRLFGRARELWGRVKGKAKYAMVAAPLMLTAIFSACEKGTETAKPSTPLVTPFERTQTATSQESDTPTPMETTVVPTNTVVITETPTKDPTKTKTPKPTDTPIETPSPIDTPETPTPTDTPIQTETPTVPDKLEVDLNIDPFKSMFATLESREFNWDKYQSGPQAREHIAFFKELVRSGSTMSILRAFGNLTYFSSAVVFDKQQQSNYPSVPKESEEHRLIRKNVVEPFRDWLYQRIPKGTEERKYIEKLLQAAPWDWQPDLLKQKDFSEWIKLAKDISGRKYEVGLGSDDLWPDFVDVVAWRIADKDFIGFEGELLGACNQRKDAAMFDDITKEFLPLFVKTLAKDPQQYWYVLEFTKIEADNLGCPIPDILTPTPTP